MLFTHFYLTFWFVLQASRQYFGAEPTTFLSTNWQEKYSLVQPAAKYVFS